MQFSFPSARKFVTTIDKINWLYCCAQGAKDAKTCKDGRMQICFKQSIRIRAVSATNVDRHRQLTSRSKWTYRTKERDIDSLGVYWSSTLRDCFPPPTPRNHIGIFIASPGSNAARFPRFTFISVPLVPIKSVYGDTSELPFARAQGR